MEWYQNGMLSGKIIVRCDSSLPFGLTCPEWVNQGTERTRCKQWWLQAILIRHCRRTVTNTTPT